MDTSVFLIVTTIICVIDGQEWEIESDNQPHIGTSLPSTEHKYWIPNDVVRHCLLLETKYLKS